MSRIFELPEEPDHEESAPSFLFERRWSPPPAGEPVYPLPLPGFRERNPRLERLLSETMRAVGRAGFPEVATSADRIRLEVFLWRFLYSKEPPNGRNDEHAR